MQLEEEIMYSRKMESQKRQNIRQEEEHRKKLKLDQEEQELMDADDLAGRSLRRRKPVNYTEKDEDISDLFEDKTKAPLLQSTTSASPAAVVPKPFPRLAPNMPPLSDISDASDEEVIHPIMNPVINPILNPIMNPVINSGPEVEGIAVSKVIDPSKGLLKLKIKRAGALSSTPPHPMAATPQHTPSSYHSPSMHSPMYSPHSGSLSVQPTSSHYRSKSSSGSEKESSKLKKSSTFSRQSRAGSSGIQDISDPDEPMYEIPFSGMSNIPQLYSPGGESSGSDSNPHRKALKLKLKLTPKDSTSEGEH